MAEPSNIDALQRKIGQVQQQLQQQRDRLASGTRTTAIVGTIILIALAGYFVYGYKEIAPILQPDELIKTGENLLSDQIGPAREALEKQISTSAPDWAKDLSKELVTNMPKVREQIEDKILDAFEQALGQGTATTNTEFQKFLKDNRPLLAQGFNELKKNPESAERFLTDLQLAMEKQLGGDMKTKAEDLLATLIDMNVQLEKLVKPGSQLTPIQSHQRAALQIARRLQLQQAAPEMIVGPSTSSAGRSVIHETGDQPVKSVAPAKPAEKPAPPKETTKPAEKPAAKPAEKPAAPKGAPKSEPKAK
jgi:DNA-binding protein YbaB